MECHYYKDQMLRRSSVQSIYLSPDHLKEIPLLLEPINSCVKSEEYIIANKQNNACIPETAELIRAQKRRSTMLEMMGYPKSSDQKIKIPSLHIELKTPTIALTDFMGNRKRLFLKKTGFLSINDVCKKFKESKKNLEGKCTLAIPNIIHDNHIRELTLRSFDNKSKSSTSSNLLKESKFCKKKNQSRLDTIQTIMDQCDALYLDINKVKRRDTLPVQHFTDRDQPLSVKQKIIKRKLTFLEIKTIKNETERMS